MDSSLQQTPDLSKLSDKDKQELQQFIVNETQKARIQQCMFSFPLCFLLLAPCVLFFFVCLFFAFAFILGGGRGGGDMHHRSSIPGSLFDIPLAKMYPLSRTAGWLTPGSRSRPLAHRRLLEEMRDGQHSQREAGGRRAQLHGELRGALFG